MKKAILCFVLSLVFVSLGEAQVPVSEINHADSTVKFVVSASVPIAGTFDKWDAGVTFTSSDYATGVLDIKIQAASVNTGSAMKDGKLESKDFFDVKNNPLITFQSLKQARQR
jgi:polyisoprenoid-binding protein YceI